MKKRFIIQVTRPHGKKALSVAMAKRLLKDTGVEVDEAYGVLLLDPRTGQWCLRGTADDRARARADALPGVQLYFDGPISIAKGERLCQRESCRKAGNDPHPPHGRATESAGGS